MCCFDCKCKSLKRLGENRNKNKETETKHKNSKKNSKNRNTGFPAHEPPRKINISKGLAGIFLFFYVCCMFSLELLCFVMFVCVFLSIVNAKA